MLNTSGTDICILRHFAGEPGTLVTATTTGLSFDDMKLRIAQCAAIHELYYPRAKNTSSNGVAMIATDDIAMLSSTTGIKPRYAQAQNIVKFAVPVQHVVNDTLHSLGLYDNMEITIGQVSCSTSKSPMKMKVESSNRDENAELSVVERTGSPNISTLEEILTGIACDESSKCEGVEKYYEFTLKFNNDNLTKTDSIGEHLMVVPHYIMQIVKTMTSSTNYSGEQSKNEGSRQSVRGTKKYNIDVFRDIVNERHPCYITPYIAKFIEYCCQHEEIHKYVRPDEFNVSNNRISPFGKYKNVNGSSEIMHAGMNYVVFPKQHHLYNILSGNGNGVMTGRGLCYINVHQPEVDTNLKIVPSELQTKLYWNMLSTHHTLKELATQAVDFFSSEFQEPILQVDDLANVVLKFVESKIAAISRDMETDSRWKNKFPINNQGISYFLRTFLNYKSKFADALPVYVDDTVSDDANTAGSASNADNMFAADDEEFDDWEAVEQAAQNETSDATNRTKLALLKERNAVRRTDIVDVVGCDKPQVAAATFNVPFYQLHKDELISRITNVYYSISLLELTEKRKKQLVSLVSNGKYEHSVATTDMVATLRLFKYSENTCDKADVNYTGITNDGLVKEIDAQVNAFYKKLQAEPISVINGRKNPLTSAETRYLVFAPGSSDAARVEAACGSMIVTCTVGSMTVPIPVFATMPALGLKAVDIFSVKHTPLDMRVCRPWTPAYAEAVKAAKSAYATAAKIRNDDATNQMKYNSANGKKINISTAPPLYEGYGSMTRLLAPCNRFQSSHMNLAESANKPMTHREKYTAQIEQALNHMKIFSGKYIAMIKYCDENRALCKQYRELKKTNNDHIRSHTLNISEVAFKELVDHIELQADINKNVFHKIRENLPKSLMTFDEVQDRLLQICPPDDKCPDGLLVKDYKLCERRYMNSEAVKHSSAQSAMIGGVSIIVPVRNGFFERVMTTDLRNGDVVRNSENQQYFHKILTKLANSILNSANAAYCMTLADREFANGYANSIGSNLYNNLMALSKRMQNYSESMADIYTKYSNSLFAAMIELEKDGREAERDEFITSVISYLRSVADVRPKSNKLYATNYDIQSDFAIARTHVCNLYRQIAHFVYHSVNLSARLQPSNDTWKRFGADPTAFENWAVSHRYSISSRPGDVMYTHAISGSTILETAITVLSFIVEGAKEDASLDQNGTEFMPFLPSHHLEDAKIECYINDPAFYELYARYKDSSIGHFDLATFLAKLLGNIDASTNGGRLLLKLLAQTEMLKLNAADEAKLREIASKTLTIENKKHTEARERCSFMTKYIKSMHQNAHVTLLSYIPIQIAEQYRMIYNIEWPHDPKYGETDILVIDPESKKFHKTHVNNYMERYSADAYLPSKDIINPLTENPKANTYDRQLVAFNTIKMASDPAYVQMTKYKFAYGWNTALKCYVGRHVANIKNGDKWSSIDMHGRVAVVLKPYGDAEVKKIMLMAMRDYMQTIGRGINGISYNKQIYEFSGKLAGKKFLSDDELSKIAGMSLSNSALDENTYMYAETRVRKTRDHYQSLIDDKKYMYECCASSEQEFDAIARSMCDAAVNVGDGSLVKKIMDKIHRNGQIEASIMSDIAIKKHSIDEEEAVLFEKSKLHKDLQSLDIDAYQNASKEFQLMLTRMAADNRKEIGGQRENTGTFRDAKIAKFKNEYANRDEVVARAKTLKEYASEIEEIDRSISRANASLADLESKLPPLAKMTHDLKELLYEELCCLRYTRQIYGGTSTSTTHEDEMPPQSTKTQILARTSKLYEEASTMILKTAPTLDVNVDTVEQDLMAHIRNHARNIVHVHNTNANDFEQLRSTIANNDLSCVLPVADKRGNYHSDYDVTHLETLTHFEHVRNLMQSDERNGRIALNSLWEMFDTSDVAIVTKLPKLRPIVKDENDSEKDEDDNKKDDEDDDNGEDDEDDNGDDMIFNDPGAPENVKYMLGLWILRMRRFFEAKTDLIDKQRPPAETSNKMVMDQIADDFSNASMDITATKEYLISNHASTVSKMIILAMLKLRQNIAPQPEADRPTGSTAQQNERQELSIMDLGGVDTKSEASASDMAIQSTAAESVRRDRISRPGLDFLVHFKVTHNCGIAPYYHNVDCEQNSTQNTYWAPIRIE